jgi:type II secretory pathway pseudopilin PulG
MMLYQNNKFLSYTGLTLLEMVIAVAIMTIVFAAFLPLFASIRNSWDTKQANAELLQNSRILIDHFHRNLSKAVKVTDVSDSSETEGYLQLEDNDGNNWRYEKGDNNYVQFGTPGDLYDLAGPVSTLQFTCYSAEDFNNPTTDVNSIRFITVQTTFTNSAVMGHNKTLTTSTYLRTNGNNQSLWQNQDVGDVGAAGSAGCSDGTWTIEGSGDDIFENSDEFHFVYQSLSGDGQIIARVVSIEDTGGWPGVGAKAGVMIRQSLNDDSKYAGIFVTPDSGAYFQRRTSTGGSTDFDPWGSSTGQAPIWFKLTRVANTFTAYKSSDGYSWTQVGPSDSVTMAGDIYIGMAVCSNDDEVLCTAVFDNVSLSELTYEDFTEDKVDSDDESITIDAPTDTCEEDLLIAAIATDGDTSTPLAPSDESWTTINVDADDNAEVTLGAWWKLADASGPTSHEFTWSAAGGQQAYGWIMRFTGHNPDAPINSWSANSDLGSSPTSPAVITTVDNCLILRLGAFDDDDIEVDEPGLPDHTTITMDESNSSSSGSVSILGSWTSGITHAEESGTNRALVLIAHGEEAWAAISLDSVKYGGQAMTKVIERIVGTNPRDYVVAYILNEAGVAAATSGTFVPTWSTKPDEVSYASVFLQNVNQSTLIGASASNSATSGATITTSALATSNGDMVIDAATCGNVGDYTVNNGFTEAIEFDMDTSVGTSGYKSATGANETPSVTHVGTMNRQVIIGFVVQSGAGDSGTVSGGAGYVKQSSSGDSGTSTFSLGSENEAQMLTIAIAPDPDSGGDDFDIRP